MIVCAPHLGLRAVSDLGGEVSERALLTRLAEWGDTIRLLLPPEAEADPGPANWRVERWSRRRTRRWWRSNAAAAEALVAAHKREPFDLAHVHSPLHFGRGALAARRRLRATFPVVMHHHHLGGTLLERMLESRACARADCVVVPSRFSARALTRAGATRPEQVVVIPRGVTPPPDPTPSGRQPPTGATARGGARSGVLLSIGRLVGRKDPLLLVEAMARVERALPGRARLRLIGDGPLAGDILERSRSLGIAASVEVCGRREEQEKWRELRSCTLFVTASRCEGFGIAAAEAMTAGAPVVAPRDSAFPEIIENGRHGLLVEPRSADAFAEAIIELLREPRRARALGTAACERASAEFSWDTAARRLQGLYRDLQHQLAGRT